MHMLMRVQVRLGYRTEERIIDCRRKCFKSMGAKCKDCKYGYPRRSNCERGTTGCAINPATGRYEYDCEYDEDVRLSPYVAEWLLAWGASMNIQRCTGTGFLDYTSKYAVHKARTLQTRLRLRLR